MAGKYLEQLISIMTPATARRFRDVNLEYKHFFSGAAVYVDAKIAITLTPVGFALKLPNDSRIVLLKERGTKQLRYFPKAPVKKDYVVLSKALIGDKKTLRKWVKISIEYIKSLPKPVKK